MSNLCRKEGIKNPCELKVDCFDSEGNPGASVTFTNIIPELSTFPEYSEETAEKGGCYYETKHSIAAVWGIPVCGENEAAFAAIEAGNAEGNKYAYSYITTGNVLKSYVSTFARLQAAPSGNADSSQCDVRRLAFTRDGDCNCPVGSYQCLPNDAC